MNSGNFPLALRPPYGGLVPAQPNANPLTFETEKDRLLRVTEAAAYCKLSRVWIDAALTTNALRHVKLGPNTRRIWLSDLRKWLDKKTVKASPRASWNSPGRFVGAPALNPPS